MDSLYANLRSDRLHVVIALPGSIYRRTRFDWTSFVTQVTLDDAHRFCVPESHRPEEGCGGIGLCHEFGLDHPIGYDEARAGDWFPKLGVGLLQKHNGEPYRFANSFSLLPYRTEILEQTTDCLTLGSKPTAWRGYAAALRRRFTVAGNRLTLSSTLTNRGEQTLRTHEYCHNFVAVDEQPIGPAYELSLDLPVQLDDANGLLAVDGGRVGWSREPRRAFHQSHGGLSETGYSWELRHVPSGVAMSEEGDFEVQRFALYGTPHCVSPEIFMGIDLPPGKTLSWQRRFRFDSPAKRDTANP